MPIYVTLDEICIGSNKLKRLLVRTVTQDLHVRDQNEDVRALSAALKTVPCLLHHLLLLLLLHSGMPNLQTNPGPAIDTNTAWVACGGQDEPGSILICGSCRQVHNLTCYELAAITE